MTTTQEQTPLTDLAHELLGTAREHDSRRAARTIASGPSQRATVIALAEGAQLGKHDAPPAATLQVLVGRARLHTADREWSVEAGDLLPVPPERHSLDALTDTVVLLTVALR
ncbi:MULTISPECIES: cupin domain-containing protein [Prauserella salsuginis group]|uniref:Quercetin dioxygenase-like cupin family protein n=2 Tax=Prauserella salsuginis group TaxID=2893672 RepID=A0A839XIH7_9PSEU|nr:MULTISPECIES: cupin domain-containing protein [Prauserella salsuginis group]MBB3661364.1 quercetin dioxygenase-like cupin family protein [Prauserella sediminis]MCR3719286.1 hypothetical protein [Prauserella flava]MCR3735701.1 hypothetical protein [Prauserella salsuginis]